MKPTQRKDAYKNIIKQIVSYISIAIVIALGVGIFLACRFGAQALFDRTDEFYREHDYRDLQVLSTIGMDKEDVEDIQKMDEVLDAEGVFSMNMIVGNDQCDTVVNVTTKTERLDQVVLLEGDLPDEEDECVIAIELAEDKSIEVGDVIDLKRVSKNADFLKREKFKVSGIMRHPDQFRANVVATYNVMISYEAVDTERLGMPYTGVLVRTDASEFNTFSKEYKNRINENIEAIESLSVGRIKIKQEEAHQKLDEAQGKLDEGKEALDNGQKEIKENEEKLDDAEQQLSDAKKEIEDAREKLANGEIELEDAQKQLEAARAQLDDGWAQLESARAQLDAASEELTAGEATLEDSYRQLENASEELTKTQQQLEEGREKLEAARAELDETEDKLESYEDTINSILRYLWETYELPGKAIEIHPIKDFTEGYTLTFDQVIDKIAARAGLSEKYIEIIKNFEMLNSYRESFDKIANGEAAYAAGLAEYEQGLSQWEAGYAEYEKNLAEYEAGLERYEQGLAEYNRNEAEWDSQYQTYLDGVAAYESGLAEYEQKIKEFSDGKEKLEQGEQEYQEKSEEYESGKAELESGKAEYSEKQKEYESGEAELESNKDKVQVIDEGQWVVLDRSVNLSWNGIYQTSIIFTNIALTFALMFVLLSIIVCYATIGKIIDEQRKLVGTTKAMGFKRNEILGKYMLFGVSAAVLGVIVAIILAYSVLQGILLGTLSNTFLVGGFPRVFQLAPSLIAILIVVIISALAVIMACGKLLKQPARTLMAGEEPPAFYKNNEGKESRSLYSSLIFRNMRTDLKRVLVTIASIAGCCALLVIGFTMKQSYVEIVNKQFGDILRYDSIIVVNPERKEEAEQGIMRIAKEENAEVIDIYLNSMISHVDGNRDSLQNIVIDRTDATELFDLIANKTGEKLDIPETGIMIFSGLAKNYGLNVGDTIRFTESNGKIHLLPISAIYKNYTGRYIFMSKEYAEEVFGEKPESNAYLFKGLDDRGLENVREKIEDVPGILSYSDIKEQSADFVSASKLMDIVIILTTVMAAIMAAVVLLNLFKIQINQKKRELTVMRVNGFSTKETVMYLLRENVITTSIGIVAGLVIGFFASRLTLSSINWIDVQMYYDLMPQPFIYALLITLIFAAVVNFFTLRKIKDLKLSDVND